MVECLVCGEDQVYGERCQVCRDARNEKPYGLRPGHTCQDCGSGRLLYRCYVDAEGHIDSDCDEHSMHCLECQDEVTFKFRGAQVSHPITVESRLPSESWLREHPLPKDASRAKRTSK